jgi:hypothetical protein
MWISEQVQVGWNAATDQAYESGVQRHVRDGEGDQRRGDRTEQKNE